MHHQHVVPGAVPTGLPSMFFRFFSSFFFGLGYQLFCLAKHTLVKTTLGTAHIQIHAVSEARALAGWIPYSQSPQLVRPSFELQDCAPFQAPRRHRVLV